MMMEPQARRRVLALIFGLTVRDGELSSAEIAFIERLHAAFEIPQQREHWIMPIGDPDEAAEALRELPPEVQRKAMRLLVEAAAVDGVIHATERTYLDVAAKAVGWTADELEERIVECLGAAHLS